ncbi:MAG TPA: hypothetical protein VHL85_08410 [Burkholderiales bacterium]|jgi:hypothetical protein|nr:hypothetical protein [Burkholderiales bacterium]
MRASLKRRIALLLLAVLAFAQMDVALAAPCPMSPGMAVDMPCEDCDTPLQSAHNDMPSVCATACAVSDQPGAVGATLAVALALQAAFFVRNSVPYDAPLALGDPPPRPPHRILLHSFLI